MNLIEHAKNEFKAAGYIPLDQEQEDGPNKWIQENILELLEVFGNQGHSGTSASYCIDMFTKLANYEPICPLTGEDDEWSYLDYNFNGPVYQNKRCSHVFKDKDGIAYNINGYVFWHWSERELDEDEEGYPRIRKYKSHFVTNYSRKKVTFPCSIEDLKPEYIEVESYEVNKDATDEDYLNKLEPGSGWWHTVYPGWIKNQYEKDFGK